MTTLLSERYRRESLSHDLIAGLTTAAVVIPQAMAYATIAGLPVQVGLYTALVPGVIYALVGTSRPLSVSTSSTIAALTAAAIIGTGTGHDPAAAAGVAATLALFAGATLFLAGVLRMGFVADFICVPALTGFKVGTGLLIIADQLGKLFGVSATGSNALETAWAALSKVGDANGPTVALAVSTIVLLVLLRRFAPRVPGPLVAVAVGVVAIAVLGLGSDGVAVIAPIPGGLPEPALPSFDHAMALLGPAVGIALMAFVESSSAARSFRSRGDGPISIDREMLAVGAAGAAGSIFGGMPASGGLSQTAVNDQAGARSQMASVMTCMVVALTLLVLAPVFDDLPEATLGAVVAVAAARLIDVREMRDLVASRWQALAVALVTAAGVLAWGTLVGLALGVALSYVLLLHALDQPPLRVLDADGSWQAWSVPVAHATEGVVVVRADLVVFWASVRRVSDRIIDALDASEATTRVLIVDHSGQPRAGVSVLAAAQDLQAELDRRRVALWISGADPERLPIGMRKDRVFASLESALAAAASPPAGDAG